MGSVRSLMRFIVAGLLIALLLPAAVVSAADVTYEIWRSTVNDSTTATRVQAWWPDTTFADTTAQDGVVYYYWVRVVTAETLTNSHTWVTWDSETLEMDIELTCPISAKRGSASPIRAQVWMTILPSGAFEQSTLDIKILELDPIINDTMASWHTAEVVSYTNPITKDYTVDRVISSYESSFEDTAEVYLYSEFAGFWPVSTLALVVPLTDTSDAPPAGLGASGGTYSDRVRLQWQPATGNSDLGASVSGWSSATPPVTFPDANLEAAVRDALGIPAPTPITVADMQDLTSLYASGQNISNIQGLQHATNLTHLDLSCNRISGISALAGLTNLTELVLGGNQISDISAVAGLTNLTTLSLWVNQIIDISAVAGLMNLNELYLDWNQISDISVVAGLTNLTGLYLDYNQISDISAVAGLTNLTDLYLHGNQISDISAVAGLTNLTELGLFENQISDISAVAGLMNLIALGLSSNQISDISAVAGLTNLTNLWLSSNQISDISAVAGLTNLKYLYLEDNQISDMSAVAGLANLTELVLDYNQIVIMNLSSADLSSLRAFSIGGNPLTDVILVDATLNQRTFNALMDGGSSLYSDRSYTGIADLSGVLTLDMSGVDFAGIPNLSAMYGMDDLETLSLAGATNLDGGQVVLLTEKLDSLNRLDVTGLWDSFDVWTQVALNSWDAVEGNTLITGQPLAVSAQLDVDWVYQNTPVVTQGRHMATLTISVDDDPNGNSQYTTQVTRESGPGDVTCQATADPLVWEIVGNRRGEGSTGEVTLQILVGGVDVGGEGSTTAVLTVRQLGDVDGNGAPEPGDVQLLINKLNGIPTPGYHDRVFDLDANGAAEPGDVQILMNVLNGQPVP